jgi:hypothetical protein
VNAGNFKNWAIPHASHDWVLVLDADERVSDQLKGEIVELFRRGPRRDGYWMRRVNYFMGHRVRFGSWGADRLLRLFRKSVSRYVGDYDHAQIDVSSNNVGALATWIDHYTCWSYDEFVRKQERYSSYQATLWYQSGRPVNWVKLYLTASFRFIHNFVLRGGFLDGAVGLQIATSIAYYSFQKQARLWQLVHGKRPTETPETQQIAA